MQQAPRDNESFRFPVSVKGIVIRAGEVVLLRNERDEWELPLGKLEPSESPQLCVAREIAKELRLQVEPSALLDARALGLTTPLRTLELRPVAVPRLSLRSRAAPGRAEENLLQALEPLAPNLWVVRRPLQTAVGDIGARMTIMRLADGALMLHSPVRLDAELQRFLNALGSVRWVLGPSKAHHLFLGDYVAAFPESVLCGAAGLAGKRRDLRFQHVLTEAPPSGWPAEVLLQRVEGAPLMNEVALLHAPSRTLVLTDLVFNVQAGPANRARVFHWLVGATGRFGPHRLIRIGLRDRVAARRSLDQILRWDFDRIVMSHGEVVDSGGARAARARVRVLAERAQQTLRFTRMIALWARLPALVRVPLVAFVVLSVGSTVSVLPLLGNMRLHPEIPWALPATLILMAAFWSCFAGAGYPAATRALRRERARNRSLPWPVWRAAIPSVLLSVVTVTSLRLALPSVLPIETQEISIDLSHYSLATVSGLLPSIAVSAAVVEEVAFRGYLQKPLEDALGSLRRWP